MEAQPASLTLGDATTVEVSSEHQLQEALRGLGFLEEGQVAVLARGPTDYIRARCHGELWSVVVRRKRMWTAQSFTAGMTSECSERTVRERREHPSVVGWLKWKVRSLPPQMALSSTQVRTLFSEYLLERKFTIPMLGD
jgi:hypothetical protein